tara:strand:- start:1214 stop:2323 length:1110 start_codon:yes stop_codon:yes gene_type:complete
MQTLSTLPPLSVELKDKSYPIHFIEEGLSALGPLLQKQLEPNSNAVLVTERYIKETLELNWAPHNFFKNEFIAPPGEGSKSLRTLEHLYTILSHAQLDRQSALVALGGGVVGDLCGFAAATYLRGIGYYQIPTSLLAMVDSSVGGKTGINLDAGKNLVGAFYHPKAVFICPAFLKTLPEKEFSSGMAEVIKYGLLADLDLYTQLCEQDPLHPEHHALSEIIRRCCTIKADIVMQDETETTTEGGRALLNLGHTFAHALEKVAGYGKYTHGEAVSIGLCLAMRLSELLGYINEQALHTLKILLEKYKLPTQLRAPLKVSALTAAMTQDKKAKHGNLRFITLKTIGQANIHSDIPSEWIEMLWREVGAHAS